MTTMTMTMTTSDHQLQIVALVCNLTPSSSSSSSSSSSQTRASHSEVETLYHEFGHGLHSLLSRTPFQHLSGTRASMDFVDTPSHLFESFACDPVFRCGYWHGITLQICPCQKVEQGRHYLIQIFVELRSKHKLCIANLIRRCSDARKWNALAY